MFLTGELAGAVDYGSWSVPLGVLLDSRAVQEQCQVTHHGVLLLRYLHTAR